MNRQQISMELDRIACDWRVPLDELRSKGRKVRGSRHVVAARLAFARRMFVEGVAHGHVAWALNLDRHTSARMYKEIRDREKSWWAA